MATLAGRAYIDVAYDPASIAKLRATTAAEGQRVASSWSKTANSFKSVGASLTRNVTLPIALAGGAAIKVAADFDASLSKIQGLVGASAAQMAVYRKSILALAPAVAQGPTALADALYFVTSSGFKGAQALDILTVSAKASTAGLGETKVIADLVTSAMTAYGSKTLSAAQATDILVAATKAGKGEPAQFAAALQENVAAANTLGVSFSQLAAATAALSTVNSNVSQDATQISGIFQAIIKPGPAAIDTLKKVGLSIGDLRKEVKDKGLLNTLLDLKNRFHGNVTEMGKLFPNVRGLRGFLTLVGTAAKRNVSIFDQVAHSTGSLNKAFATALTKNPQVQFKKLTAQLQVLAIVIGEQLIPIGLKFAAFLTSLANKFKGLSSGQQTFVLIAAGVAAAIGPVLSLAGNVAKLAEGLYKVAKILRIVTALQWLFNAALDANPIGLIIIGLAALAVAFVIAYRKSATFRAIVQGALHAVAAAIDFVRQHWQAFLAVIPVIGPLIAAAASHFGLIRRIGVAAFNALKGAVQGFIGIAQGVVSAVESIVSTLQSLYDKAQAIASIIPNNPFAGGPGASAGRTARVGRGHAAGGPVLAGVSYPVGERGPELFTPNMNGTIIPNNKLSMGADITIYIGNEAIDPHLVRIVRSENQQTARRVKAGRRSTA